MSTAVLADPGQDAHLREHGFAVVPLPAAVSVAPGLIADYGEHHGWSGTGFEPDLTNPDTAYRRAVTGLIGGALDEASAALFTDHAPFLRNFLCKWPGPGSDLYLHRDWMYVDERPGHHTYVVWIPLQDVDLTNGPLQVLRGSHRIDAQLRGTHLNAGWIGLDDVIRPRLETVTVRLGEAVILDNATVHCSLPNESGEARLVAAVGLRPREAPLVHYCLLKDGSAARYDVDEDFFQTITPQDLMATPPTLPISERLAADQLELDAAALAALLDGVGARTVARPTRAPSSSASPAVGVTADLAARSRSWADGATQRLARWVRSRRAPVR